MDGCAAYGDAAGEWTGNLRDRLIFAMLAETGMRLGEVLGMAISDVVMGRAAPPMSRSCRGLTTPTVPE